MNDDDFPATPADRRQAIAALLGAGAAAIGLGDEARADEAHADEAHAAEAAARARHHPRTGALRWTSGFIELDPVARFRQAMRIQRSLEDEADILHWYHFIMVAVPAGMAPRPVVRWEGIELSHHRRIGADRYRLHGHNLSFARDLASGAFVTEVVNPVTRQTVAVPTMTLTGDPGLIRSPEGVVTLDHPTAAPRPDYRMLRREGNFVKVDSIRVPPESWPVTFIEMGYEATPAAFFDDPALKWLPSTVCGAYVFPWPAWMQMGEAPGHMFAAWSGYKLRDVEELPAEFRARAERDHPELLRVDLTPFARPVPGVAP